MSILLAKVKDGAVYLATDTRVVANDDKWNELCECNYKIQKLENGILVGVVGDRFCRQAVFSVMENFQLDKNGELSTDHIVQTIATPLFFHLKENGLLKYGNQEEELYPYMPVSILLAHKDKLFELCGSFMVLRYEGYQALGKASDFAQYSMSNLNNSDNLQEEFTKILDLVAKNTHLVGKPYLFIDTKTQEYTLTGEEE